MEILNGIAVQRHHHCHRSQLSSLAAAAPAEENVLLWRPLLLGGLQTQHFTTLESMFIVRVFVFYLCFLFYTLSLLFAVLLCLAMLGILRAAVKILLFSSHERETERERREEHNSFALITGPTIRIPFARRISPKFDNNNKIARSQTYCYKQLAAHLVSFACKEAGEEAEEKARRKSNR